jgi:hypothetical protein
MVNSLDSGVVSSDFSAFHNNKVFKIPEILINDVKYKGGFYSKFILDAICTGFVNSPEEMAVCHQTRYQFVEVGPTLNLFTIIVIVVIITFCMIIALYCYRRIVNRSLEQSLNEKIQQQAIFSMGQYQVFKEERSI